MRAKDVGERLGEDDPRLGHRHDTLVDVEHPRQIRVRRPAVDGDPALDLAEPQFDRDGAIGLRFQHARQVLDGKQCAEGTRAEEADRGVLPVRLVKGKVDHPFHRPEDPQRTHQDGDRHGDAEHPAQRPPRPVDQVARDHHRRLFDPEGPLHQVAEALPIDRRSGRRHGRRRGQPGDVAHGLGGAQHGGTDRDHRGDGVKARVAGEDQEREAVGMRIEQGHLVAEPGAEGRADDHADQGDERDEFDVMAGDRP